jgi:hypothetical protein
MAGADEDGPSQLHDRGLTFHKRCTRKNLKDTKKKKYFVSFRFLLRALRGVYEQAGTLSVARGDLPTALNASTS